MRRSIHLRRLISEQFESRRPLAADLAAFDVNNDLLISPVDALIVINEINADSSVQSNEDGVVSLEQVETQIECDTNSDGVVSPQDVLGIINQINSGEVTVAFEPQDDAESLPGEETPTDETPPSDTVDSTDPTDDTTSPNEDSTNEDSSSDGSTDDNSSDDASSDDSNDSAPLPDETDDSDDVNEDDSTDSSTDDSSDQTSDDDADGSTEDGADDSDNAEDNTSDNAGDSTNDESSGDDTSDDNESDDTSSDDADEHCGRDGGASGRAARGAERVPARVPVREARPIFRALDANEDGALSSEEVPAALWEHLVKADGDADGLVTADELKSYRDAQRLAAVEAFFGRLDSDSSGSLTSSDMPRFAWRMVSRADADGNGEVSLDEFVTATLRNR